MVLNSGAALTVTDPVIPNRVTDYGNPLNPDDDKYSNDWYLLILQAW